MRAFLLLVSALAAFAATPASAERRVCEAVLRGPAGEHVVQILVDDGVRMHGWATWRPPLQGRSAALPALNLHYRLNDPHTGRRSALLYVEIMHAARISDSEAQSATVGIGPYGGDEIARRDWASFADARERARRDDIGALAGGVAFGGRDVIELAETAPQIHSTAITDRGGLVSEGVWNLTTRPALDALFGRAFATASVHAENPRRHCRAPNYMDGHMIIDFENRPGGTET